MSRSGRSSSRTLLLCVALGISVLSWAEGKYQLGRTASNLEIAGWDIDVRPDGKGLPFGSGSVGQGQSIYDEKCASCHGSFGESNAYMVIAGGVGTLGTRDPIRSTGSKLQYASTLFDYIRRAMPFANPQSLSANEVYALTAYVLHLSDIVAADVTLDQHTLPRLVMPNAKGFTLDHGLMKLDGQPDTHNTNCMTDCAAEVKITSMLPAHAKKASVKTTGVRPAVRVPVLTSSGDIFISQSKSVAIPIELIQRYGCVACHGLDNKIVGPGFKEIAAKYGAAAGAEKHLIGRIKAGGSGVWGSIPMPAQSQLNDTELLDIVKWLVAGAKTQ